MNARRHFETGQCIDRLVRRCENVDESLVSSLLELLAAVLILVDRTKNCNYLFLGRQRNRAGNLSSRSLHRVDNLSGRLINQLVIIRLQRDSHYLICHKKSRLLFALFDLSTTSGDCTHFRACLLYFTRKNYLPVGLLLTCTVTCRQFSNMTFAPRKTHPLETATSRFTAINVTARL